MPPKPTRKAKPTEERGGKRPATASARRLKKPVKKSDDRLSLRRFLAATGLDARRNIDEYISAGRISIDGEIASEPSTKVDPGKQRICIDGERAKLQPKSYFLLNKPKGYLCTHRDPLGRRRAIDLVSAPGGLRLFTVGRLDENSEGLILVTNDGELANKMAHPRYQVRRLYRVQVAGIPKKETLDELKSGLYFNDGRFRLHGAKRLKTQGKSSFLEIEMREGQNREIRRLMARVGHKVLQLQRVEFGPLKLGRIGSGKFRNLTSPEVKELRQFVEDMEEIRRRTPTPPRSPEKRKARGAPRSGATAEPTEKTVGSKTAGRKGAAAKATAKPATRKSRKKPVADTASNRKKQAEAKAGKPKAAKVAKKKSKPRNAKPEGFVPKRGKSKPFAKKKGGKK